MVDRRAPRHVVGLPAELTSLIGRESEISAIKELLSRETVRLLTVIGPGGAGKTRVATRVAGEIRERFEDGVFFVSLDPIREADLVKNAILSVNEEYLRVALDLGANRWQMIWRVLLPGAVPQIWGAIAVCSGIMWTYIVLAEFINSSQSNLGVGYLLFVGSRTGGNGAGKIFGMIIVIALISSLTDFLLQFIRKKLFDW